MVIKSDSLHSVGHSKSRNNSCNNLLHFLSKSSSLRLSFFIQNTSVVGWCFCRLILFSVNLQQFHFLFFFCQSKHTYDSFQLSGFLIALSGNFSLLTNFFPMQIMLECDQVAVSIFLLEERNLTMFCVSHFNVKMIFKIPTKVQIKLSEGLIYMTRRGIYQMRLLKNVSQKKEKWEL